MKIINFSAHDRRQGASTRAFDLSRALSENGHEVTFVTNNFCHFTKEFIHAGGPANYEFHDGVRCEYLNTPAYFTKLQRLWNMVVNFLRISFYRSEQSVEVVIGPSVPLLTGLAAYIYSRRVKARYIFEIRDVWPDALVSLGILKKSNPLFFIFKYIERFLYRNSAVIVSALPNVSKHILKEFPNYPKSNLHFIPNPIAADLLAASRKNSGSESLNPQPVFRYIGGFGIVHDVHTILHAAIYYIRNLDENAYFEFYGNGLKFEAIKAIVCRENLQDRIKLLGHIPKFKALEEASSATVLLAAVPDSEIFEFGINLNKLYLYLVAGKPIAFAGNVPNDMVADEGFGRSVTAGDHTALANAIADLSNQSNLDLQALKRNMRHYVEENLSQQKLGKKYHDILMRS